MPALDRWAGQFTAWVESVAGPGVAARWTWRPATTAPRSCVALLVILYVPAVTGIAWLLGRVLERYTLERQKRDGAWRGEWAMLLGRVPQLAASRGERAQRRINSRLYGDLDRTWGRQNGWSAAMLMFTEVYNFLSTRLLAYLPALPALCRGQHELPHFAASSELTAELIRDVSWFINVMPAIATLKANAGRLIGTGRGAWSGCKERQAFYAETGVSRFDRTRGTGRRGADAGRAAPAPSRP